MREVCGTGLSALDEVVKQGFLRKEDSPGGCGH